MHNKMHQDEETFVSISPDKPGSARVVRAEVTEAPISVTELAGAVQDAAAGAVVTFEGVVRHRVGDLAVGDAALAVAVSSDHRAEAFAVCGQIVEEVKKRLPVWKRQTFTDGTAQWSNLA